MVICGSSSSGSRSSNVTVEPLSSAPAQHEKYKRDDASSNGEANDNKDTSDSAGILEKATVVGCRRRGRSARCRIVNNLGDGIDLSFRVRARHGLRDERWRGGDNVTGGIRGGERKSGCCGRLGSRCGG